jgi:hypothetical protein
MAKNELAVVEKKLSPIVAAAQSLEIKTPKDMTEATDVLSKLNKIGDAMEAEKEKTMRPALDTVNAIRAQWKPFETVYKESIALIRGKMSAYQTEQLRLKKEADQKIADRVGDGRGKFTPETAVRKMEENTGPADAVATDAGLVKFRTDKKLKIMDETMIPREYLIPDEKKILEDLKKGKSVMGCIIEEIQVPINFR